MYSLKLQRKLKLNLQYSIQLIPKFMSKWGILKAHRLICFAHTAQIDNFNLNFHRALLNEANISIQLNHLIDFIIINLYIQYQYFFTPY
jgi:hypothetical protein